jgi:hypothetical protein
MTAHLFAFVDESQSDVRRDPHCYVLAAGLCETGDLEHARLAMLELQLPGQTKVHWRDESLPRRHRIVEVLATLPLQHLIVVRGGRAGERPERRRRHCLERLLHELEQLQGEMVTCESRGPKDDRRDRLLLDKLRARKVVASGMRLDHTLGPKDPLLWIPDALCGAVTHRRTGESNYLKVLDASTAVQIINIKG